MTNHPVNPKRVGPILSMCVGLSMALMLTGPAQAAEPNATISAIVLSVTHRPGPEGTWRHSRIGTSLPTGSRVRTGRRSRCEIKFPDGSTVRMGPRSDLVIKQLKDRNLGLEKGRLFAHIVSGTVARITGASATAAIKGTWVELIRGNTEQGDVFRAWGGSAELFNDLGSMMIGPGTQGSAGPGQAPSGLRSTPPRMFSGGAAYPWWQDVKPGVNIGATPGTPAGRQQQSRHSSTHPTIATTTTTPPPTKGQLNIIVQQVPRQPATGSVSSSGWRIAQALGGLAGAAAADETQVFGRRFFGPYRQVDVYGLLAEGGSLAGSRVRFSGVLGNTYGQIGARVSSEFEGDVDVELDEAFALRRTETDEFTIGRQRLLRGPVNNSNLGKLLGFELLDGVRWCHTIDMFTETDLMWIDDYAPWGESDTSAWYLRVQRLVCGGQVGINWLDQTGAGSGVSCDFSWPAVPGKLDIYGEFGDDPCGAHLDTVGIYLPGLYQRTGLDVFVERARRSGYPSATTLLAYQEFENDLSGVAIARKAAGGDTEFGLGLIKRFGQLGD